MPLIQDADLYPPQLTMCVTGRAAVGPDEALSPRLQAGRFYCEFEIQRSVSVFHCLTSLGAMIVITLEYVGFMSTLMLDKLTVVI